MVCFEIEATSETRRSLREFMEELADSWNVDREVFVWNVYKDFLEEFGRGEDFGLGRSSFEGVVWASEGSDLEDIDISICTLACC